MVTSVHVLLPFAFKVLCTRLIVSMLRGSDYMGHPNESLARGTVYSRSVTGYKSRLRTKTYTASHKPNTVGKTC